MVCDPRPTLTADSFARCVKTANAGVLTGGSDARHSNEAIAALLHEALGAEGIDENTFTLLPAGHEAVGALLSAVGYVDVVIPRGGAGLIRFVRENARIPVIETGAGIVHTYFDIDGDLEKGRAVVCNAKTRRVSVCNALDCLVIHRGRLTDLPELCAPLAGCLKEDDGSQFYSDVYWFPLAKQTFSVDTREPEPVDTVVLVFRARNFVYDSDTVNFAVMPDSTTAVAGTDYEITTPVVRFGKDDYYDNLLRGEIGLRIYPTLSDTLTLALKLIYTHPANEERFRLHDRTVLTLRPIFPSE